MEVLIRPEYISVSVPQTPDPVDVDDDLAGSGDGRLDVLDGATPRDR